MTKLIHLEDLTHDLNTWENVFLRLVPSAAAISSYIGCSRLESDTCDDLKRCQFKVPKCADDGTLNPDLSTF